MKKHIHRHYIKPKSPEWYDFRNRGYGMSEISTVLAQYFPSLAEYVWGDPIKLHLEKIGEPVQQFNGNVTSEAGIFEEPLIGQRYKHWDNNNPDALEMYRRLNSGAKPINKIISPKCYITNDKYPWLFYSPDALEYEGGKWVGNLEFKNTNSLEAGRYPNRISPSFIIQVLGGLLITEKKYARVCILIDGSWFEVITVFPDQKRFDTIVEKTRESWGNVLKAREIKKVMGIDCYYGINPEYAPEAWTQPTDHLGGRSPLGMLNELEPEFQGTASEKKFVEEYFPPTQEFTEREGNQFEWEQLMAMKPLKDKKSEIETELQKIDINLIKSMAGVHQINFEQGYYSRKPNKNGVVRPYVSPKLYE